MIPCSIEWRGATFHVDAEALALAGRHGRSWYADAGESIARYALRHDLPFRRVCDVVAILSPRVQVTRNAELAHAYLQGLPMRGVMRSRVKALAAYERTGAFNGPKVNAFSKALQGDPNAVVVDAWVVRALGHGDAAKGPGYERIADRVRSLAKGLGWPPAETQAALWCGTRSLVGYGGDYGDLRMPDPVTVWHDEKHLPRPTHNYRWDETLGGYVERETP